MSFFPRPVKPSVALADFRAFLQTRTPHQVGFALASMAIPLFFVFLFILEAVEKEYHPPDVTWVRNVDPNRPRAEIIAENKRHSELERRLKAAQEAELERRRAPFKKMDEAMDKWGL